MAHRSPNLVPGLLDMLSSGVGLSITQVKNGVKPLLLTNHTFMFFLLTHNPFSPILFLIQ